VLYQPSDTLREFNERMTDIRKSIPGSYEAFLKEKEAITQSDKLPEKTK